MHAQSNGGKKYVHILELHRGITDENVRDSIPRIKVATFEGTSYINWRYVLLNGLMPIVKHSPTITKKCLTGYYFTPEFWACGCEFDWLHASHYKCEDCGAMNFWHEDNQPELMFTSDIWGLGPFESIEVSVLKVMEIVAHNENKSALAGVQTVYKHLKAFDFNWVKAYAIENF